MKFDHLVRQGEGWWAADWRRATAIVRSGVDGQSGKEVEEVRRETEIAWEELKKERRCCRACRQSSTRIGSA
jgi:hypothetical protein